jgi:hypothetical protein
MEIISLNKIKMFSNYVCSVIIFAKTNSHLENMSVKASEVK